ncbi:kinesin-domain-containing protein, partial [Aureobasidium sp. EXF-3399]
LDGCRDADGVVIALMEAPGLAVVAVRQGSCPSATANPLRTDVPIAPTYHGSTSNLPYLAFHIVHDLVALGLEHGETGCILRQRKYHMAAAVLSPFPGPIRLWISKAESRKSVPCGPSGGAAQVQARETANPDGRHKEADKTVPSPYWHSLGVERCSGTEQHRFGLNQYLQHLLCSTVAHFDPADSRLTLLKKRVSDRQQLANRIEWPLRLDGWTTARAQEVGDQHRRTSRSPSVSRDPCTTCSNSLAPPPNMDSMSTPPTSPMSGHPHRASIASALRTPRSSSRLSLGGRRGSSRASDEDSKTAVKVAVRVRPPLQSSDPGYDLIPQRFRASTCDVSSATNLAIQSTQGKKLFVFDRVFGEETTQQGVWEYVSGSVDSFIQGYNVSILAYGQSGAGKSYTMGTADSEGAFDPVHAGIVPRAAAALFEKLNATPTSSAPLTPSKSGLRSPARYSVSAVSSLSNLHRQTCSDKSWTLTATYAEIYNEQLRDLLVPSTVPEADRPQVSIREDTKGRILLIGLVQKPINSADDLLEALSFGSNIRQTDSTAINAKSSRSHAILSLNLTLKKGPSVNRRASVQVDNSTSNDAVVTTESKLHFVDLAGSERLKNTGAQGDRAKEGISINAGLASLGKVISQLSTAKQGGYISYRDSRLTRILQDSLGGTAITYMVACVNPAEFHLSETLNTVTYAQRARAIQSKPEIQQTTEEADKASIIARLQAEVAFLREQVNKNNEKGEQRILAAGDHKERRESELQDQLMDMQESYNALSGRHAKLISEISKAKESSHEDTPTLRDAVGESAMERLKRSNSFAEAVEQVVMEYEKTIQSLEASLSNTRSTLSTSESSLMEREARIAYMESQAHQLQVRLQKAGEREANNDAYLRDLETQIEGATTSEEKSSTMIASLRKELGRVKDTENNSEQYIATIEEKLAEAEQDREIMQRELDRLENVIERQRSIGRLDNLLAELDNIRHGEQNGRHQQLDGHASDVNGHDPFVKESSTASRGVAVGDQVTEQSKNSTTHLLETDGPTTAATDQNQDVEDLCKKDEQNAAQSRFMADKLETMTQELFDLRSEHETTINDYDNLQRKYETALQALAKMHETNEEETRPDSRNSDKPESFLEGAGVNGMKENGQPAASSRSLAAELSSGSFSRHSFTSMDEGPDETIGSQGRPLRDIESDEGSTVVNENEVSHPPQQQVLAHEMETLRQLHVQRESSLKEISDNYMRLSEEHKNALSQVENLKREVQRAQLATNRQSSPSLVKPIIRRKPSQDLMANTTTNNDRAMRSFASLRNIALDNFESNIDVRQNFEIHLNTIMGDLHDRTEKMQALDAEVMAARRDLDAKTAIITGLTRERASVSAANTVDFTVVGHMRDQLMRSEQQVLLLRESHESREKELQFQVDELKSQLQQHAEKDVVAGGEQAHDDRDDHVANLQKQLSSWVSKHAHTMTSSKESETKLLATIATLETSLSEAHKSVASRDAEYDAAVANLDQERAQHQELVNSLQKQIDNHQTASHEHNQKLSLLEQSYASIRQQVDEDSKGRELTEKELQTHRNLVSNLESQIEGHKSAIEIHEQNLETLKASHTEELDSVKTALTTAENNFAERHAALEARHKSVQQDLKRSQVDLEELLAEASAILGHETDVGRFHSHLTDFVGQSRDIGSDKDTVVTSTKVADLEAEMVQLKTSNQELVSNMERAVENERKSATLVQELEDQLNSTYDLHQDTTKRLSAIQSERHTQLEEATSAKNEMKKELEDAKLKVSLLESQLAELQRRSMASTSRDSLNYARESLSPEAAAFALARTSSQTSLMTRPKSNATNTTSGLPSPPPAIPLPPIPTPGLSGLSPFLSHSSSIPMGLGIDARTSSPAPTTTFTASSPPGTPHHSSFPQPPSTAPSTVQVDAGYAQVIEEQESRIRTIEKHLFAEKQLTATLEEALVDLETSQNKTRQDLESWRKKCSNLEDELVGLRKERTNSRASMQQVEEEREMRHRAERARQALEERMRELNAGQKKKKGMLNCF